ncbi:PREDICTED: putative glucan endo-1,3-beta-glucosidase GVI [Camelina sativa]|uniref:glucan endo-1,3-beta-D-glucosidase n=1 Tax=Camelina sativa TaxID=90675 RepID=A0ABM0WPV3_CAMSA|nr:PREDICTED: putative glucan endo-1,3-beta-glucosidase GVI [Camelina sativa]
MDSKPTGLAVAIFLLLSIQILYPAGVAGDITGVCYGRNGNNLPTPSDTVALYKTNNIDAIRMYEPFADMLEALRGSGLSVMFGPRNEEIQSLAQNPAAATNFVSTWITPYINDVSIKWITIGNEVFPGDIAPFVPAAIRNVNAALTSSGITGISVTTVLAMTALANTYPPSAATFLPDLTEIMTEISSILSQTNSPLMANVYPYFAYASDTNDISLDYASFKSQTPIVIDGDLQYSNMFAAMVDGFNAALEKINAGNVVVMVAETGWPTEGNEPHTSVDNAKAYNTGIMTCGGSARMRTPRRPYTPVDVFLFAMFRENQKDGPVEQSFGIFSPDMTPVYDIFCHY